MTETFYATQQVRVLPGQGWPPAGIECCVVRRRAIGKWLNAGVMEAGELSYPQQGTPQGGVISRTLSNVYLHEVLDQWFEHEVKPRLRGRAFEVRYADDGAGVRARRRREAGAWGAGETSGEIRSAPASGQDADGGLSQSAERTAGRLAARAQLRDVGVHPLLGTLQEGAMGGQAQDGEGPIQPSAERHRSMVPKESAQEPARAARGTESQVARTRCLLRHHRERGVIGAVPARGPQTMAQMAQPTGRANTDEVGPVRPDIGRLSPPARARRAQCVPLSSETIVRGAGCRQLGKSGSTGAAGGQLPAATRPLRQSDLRTAGASMSILTP